MSQIFVQNLVDPTYETLHALNVSTATKKTVLSFIAPASPRILVKNIHLRFTGAPVLYFQLNGQTAVGPYNNNSDTFGPDGKLTGYELNWGLVEGDEIRWECTTQSSGSKVCAFITIIKY